MASARLPSKPLAGIHGKPMILHMLDRGAGGGYQRWRLPAATRKSPPRSAAAGGTRGDDRSRRCRPGSDRVHAALAELDPGRAHDVVVNLQGDFPTLEAGGCAWSSPHSPIRESTSAPWSCRSATEVEAATVVSS